MIFEPSNKISQDEIIRIANEKGYNVLHIYSENWRQRVVMMDNERYKYDIPLNKLKMQNRKESFDIVSKYNKYVLENIQNWLFINNKSFKLSDKNKYINNSELLKFDCFVCKESFYSKWGSIQQGHGCGVCKGFQIRESNSLATLRPNIANEWLYSENNLTPHDVSQFSEERVLWKCSKCTFEWECIVGDRTGKNNTGCPNCKEKSRGETKIKDFLNYNNIRFIPQHRYKNCRNVLPLPFDFYLPDYGILIEFNGKQHYFPFDFSTNSNSDEAKKEFEEIQKRDKIKLNYCCNNNIPLLIIPYTEFNNIEFILIDYLNL